MFLALKNTQTQIFARSFSVLSFYSGLVTSGTCVPCHLWCVEIYTHSIYRVSVITPLRVNKAVHLQTRDTECVKENLWS